MSPFCEVGLLRASKSEWWLGDYSDEGLNTVTLEILNYLKKQPTKANSDQMKEYVQKLRADTDGRKLTRAEIMQFVNLRPITVSTRSAIVCQID